MFPALAHWGHGITTGLSPRVSRLSYSPFQCFASMLMSTMPSVTKREQVIVCARDLPDIEYPAKPPDVGPVLSSCKSRLDLFFGGDGHVCNLGGRTEVT